MTVDLVASNLLELWGKGAAVLLVGFLLIGCLGSFSPAFRHRTWMFVMTALIAIPLLLAVSPRWEVIPAWWKVPVSAPAAVDMGVAASRAFTPETAVELPAVALPAASAFRWQTVLISIWAVGVLVLLTRTFLGGIWLSRLRGSGADSSESPEWIRFHSRADTLIGESNGKRKVKLVVSEKIAAPITWGWLRPRIGLPRAALGWPEANLEMVLLHELEHVRRQDALAMLISRLVLILNWMNPLVWFALRQAENCREAACDARVLEEGHRSTSYADLLFQQARSVPAPVRSWATAVAETGTLERRVKMILNTTPQSASRGPVPASSWLIGLPLLTLAAIIGIAGLAEPAIAQEKKPAVPGPDEPGNSQEKKDDGTVYRLKVQPDGEGGVIIELDGKPVDRKKLSQRLSKKVESPSVVMSVHEMTPAAEVVAIVDLVGKAGITKFKFGSFNEETDSRADTLRKVKEGWEKPDPVMAKKLKSIMISKVEFLETPLTDALAFLSARSGELAPDKKRVNIVIKELGELKQTRITLSLKNVPLSEALHFTAELASARLEVEPHAVVIRPRKSTDADQPSPLFDRKADAVVTEKLNGIIVPKIEFVNTPLLDALAFLQAKSGELDVDAPPQEKGINMVLHIPEESGIDPASVKLTLTLNAVPLAEVLKYTCSLGGLKYGVANGAVVIRPE